MKKLIYITVFFLIAISCGEQETIKYDVFGEETLIKFEAITSNLEVIVDSEGSIEIPISVSTFASTERTVNVEVLAFPEGTEDAAAPDQYIFNGDVVIPANELEGSIRVTGLDDGLEEGETLRLQLQIVGGSFPGINIAEGIHTVNIFQICPIPEDYLVGRYMLNSPLSNIKCSADQTFFIGNNVEVEISIGASGIQRVFRAKYSPGSCDGFNGPYDFVLSLACGTVSLAEPVTTGVSCSSVADITIANDAGRPSNYNVNDDSQITVNVIDDINGSCTDCCGAPFLNQSFTLTKI